MTGNPARPLLEVGCFFSEQVPLSGITPHAEFRSTCFRPLSQGNAVTLPALVGYVSRQVPSVCPSQDAGVLGLFAVLVISVGAVAQAVQWPGGGPDLGTEFLLWPRSVSRRASLSPPPCSPSLSMSPVVQSGGGQRLPPCLQQLLVT